jgi:hypothetical protein
MVDVLGQKKDDWLKEFWSDFPKGTMMERLLVVKMEIK